MYNIQTEKDKRNMINKNMRWIAYNVFNRKSSHKFVNAFDKLNGRVKLDHNISITELADGLGRCDYNIFDVLTGSELDMVLESSDNLREMYKDVIVRKSM